MKDFQLIAGILFFSLLLSACCPCPPDIYEGSFSLEESSKTFLQIDTSKTYVFKAVDSSLYRTHKIRQINRIDSFLLDATCHNPPLKPTYWFAQGDRIEYVYTTVDDTTDQMSLEIGIATADYYPDSISPTNAEDLIADGFYFSNYYYSFPGINDPNFHLILHPKNISLIPNNDPRFLPYQIIDTIVDNKQYKNLIIHPNIDLNKYRISKTRGFIRFYDHVENLSWELDSIY